VQWYWKTSGQALKFGPKTSINQRPKTSMNQIKEGGGLAGAGTPIECNEYEEKSPPTKKFIVAPKD
jgi:hypothetical protein